MKKLAILFVLLLCGAANAQAPTKLFDFRAGNNIVDNGTVQPQAWYIAFKDAAARQAVTDAICAVGNYDALDPATRPSKQAFALRELQFHLRDIVRQSREKTAAKATPVVDTTDLP